MILILFHVHAQNLKAEQSKSKHIAYISYFYRYRYSPYFQNIFHAEVFAISDTISEYTFGVCDQEGQAQELALFGLEQIYLCCSSAYSYSNGI